MASRYTYDDFQKAAQSSGLAGQFSDADLKLAQENPDAGMSILKYKQDYANATTDEARALANLGAEGIRSSYGGYSGGGNGGSFYLDALSPNDYQSSTAPTYQNNYADTISALLDKQLNYGSYSYGEAQPEYTNRYDDTIQDLLGQIVNRQEFSYDPETDQLYSQYRKQYAREGQRATQDALGTAAAASGGIPSSYAVNAATQAGDYYASQMTDKIPELYELAYNKYMNDYNMKLSDLSAVSGQEQSDYAKYLDQLSQYNTNRSFDYQTWADTYNRINNDLQTASGLEQIDYNRYLNDLSQYNTDRSFSYQQLLDEVNNQTANRTEALNKALTAAELGDYSFLNDMGIDTSNNPTDYERQYQLAQLAAQYGDYSGLKALGINPDLTTVSSGSSGGSSKKSGSSGTSMTTSVAKEYAKNGIFNEQVLAALRKAGYSDEYIEQVYGYTPESSESSRQTQTGGQTQDSGQLISVAGYGEISYDDAETLEKAGLIKLQGMDSEGKPIYTPVSKNLKESILMTR